MRSTRDSRAAPPRGATARVILDAARTWAESRGRTLATRVEIAGETAFCYAGDAAPLLADLAARSGVRYLHRPANLEDLFIKLTGRELRD